MPKILNQQETPFINDISLEQNINIHFKDADILLKISSISVLILIFLALFVPTVYKNIQIVFLLISFFVLSILVFKKNLKWSKETLLASFTYSLFGLLYSLYGIIRNNPGAFPVLTVMFLWPLLYAFISPLMNQTKSLVWLTKIFLFTLTIIVFYTFYFFAHKVGFIHGWAYIKLNLKPRLSFYNGYIRYNLYNISSLFFLVPFAFNYAWFRLKEKKISKWLLLILLLSLIISLFSGRKGLWVTIVLTPFLMGFSNLLLNKKWINIFNFNNLSINRNYLKYFIIPITIGFVFVLIGLHFNSITMWNYFKSGFEFNNPNYSSAYSRGIQFRSLIKGWIDSNVIFGAGNGAVASIIRLRTMPWAYELSYVNLLFSTGLVGCIFYFLWFLWGILRLRNALNKREDLLIYVIPILTGIFGILIGNATNPYIEKFDYLWIIFLPHLIAGGIKYQRIRK